PLEDGAHHLPHLVAAWQVARAERIEHEVGRVDGAGGDGRLVGRVDDRPRAVALVESEPRRVMRADLRIGAERRVIGQTLEIELRAERARLLADAFVECGADAVSGPP